MMNTLTIIKKFTVISLLNYPTMNSRHKFLRKQKNKKKVRNDSGFVSNRNGTNSCNI